MVTSSAPVTSDRFQAVEVANVLPGACGICSGSRGPFINTNRYFKMHGTLLICENCLTEMARLFGLTPESEQPDTNSDIMLTHAEFQETVSGISDAIVSNTRDLIDYLTGAGFASLLEESLSDSREDDGDGEGAAKAPQQVIGSSSVEGSDDVSDGSGDGLDAIVFPGDNDE